MKLHLAIIALLLSTCCGRGLAQAQAQVQVQAQVQSQPTASASQPGVVTLTASARAVLLDVVATDQLGNPLPGLTAADFAVTEDGSPQTIASFEAHHPAAVTPHPAVAPNPPSTPSPAVMRSHPHPAPPWCCLTCLIRRRKPRPSFARR